MNQKSIFVLSALTNPLSISLMLSNPSRTSPIAAFSLSKNDLTPENYIKKFGYRSYVIVITPGKRAVWDLIIAPTPEGEGAINPIPAHI